jgi:protein tyrosine phosphatase type 4A
VTDVVRCCKATYSNSALNDYGIEVHDYIFPDGEPPPKLVIDQWLDLIDARFKDETKKEEGPCIAAHCVAGLGRFALCLFVLSAPF